MGMFATNCASVHHSQGVHPSYMRLRLSMLMAARSKADTCSGTLSASASAPAALRELFSSSSRPASLAAKRSRAAAAACRRALFSREGACGAGAALLGLPSGGSSDVGPLSGCCS